MSLVDTSSGLSTQGYWTSALVSLDGFNGIHGGRNHVIWSCKTRICRYQETGLVTGRTIANTYGYGDD